LGKDLFKALLKNEKALKSSHPRVWQNHVYGEQKPWRERDGSLPVGECPWRNHASQFWWKSVKGFWRGKGRILGLCRHHYNTNFLPKPSVVGVSFCKHTVYS